MRNKFNTLWETSERPTPNVEYEHFVTSYIEAAAECFPTKPKAKCRVPWEAIAIREKWGRMIIASLFDKRNPTDSNAQKLKKAQRELTHNKEQLEYIQSQMNKTRNSVEDRQLRLATQTVKEMSGRKSTLRAKLKAANQKRKDTNMEKTFQESAWKLP